MDRKQLEIELEALEGFQDPSPGLEQYTTPATLASTLLHHASLNADLDSPVVDLGCGTGVLAVGAALLGSDAVGVERDAGALAVARRNAVRAGVRDRVEWVQADVSRVCLDLRDASVVMNPPFGAQRHGADRAFLRRAAEISRVTYTVHNEGSHAFVEEYVGELGGTVTQAFAASLELPRTYEFHREESREIPVEVYRLEFGAGSL